MKKIYRRVFGLHKWLGQFNTLEHTEEYDLVPELRNNTKYVSLIMRYLQYSMMTFYYMVLITTSDIIEAMLPDELEDAGNKYKYNKEKMTETQIELFKLESGEN
jgi:hypothetical protein